MSTVVDVVDHFVSESLGTVGTDLFRFALPEEANNATMVRDYAGEPPIYDQGQNTAVLKYPRVQIVARNLNVNDAYLAAQAAYGVIQGIENLTINGTKYLRALPLQEPFWLRQDDQNRHYVVFNARITVAG